ncbi:MAG: 5,6-dimethylbenzimidazole synthase [Micrococcales bacterium]|nr:5,6-dimethylbenzimidazole synthase [Micrococcales bacterium]
MIFTAEQAGTLWDVMRWRRDVRHFRPDALDEATLERLRAAMDLAPSVGNARPWRVLRVDDPGLRAAARAEFEECNALAATEYDEGARAAYLRLKLAGMEVAPVQLAVFTDTDPASGRGLGRRTMPETLRASTAMAVYSLWLAARAENLGLGWVSILRPEVVGRILGVPEEWAFEGWLCLGRPEESEDAVSHTPLLHRVGWQENATTQWLRR